MSGRRVNEYRPHRDTGSRRKYAAPKRRVTRSLPMSFRMDGQPAAWAGMSRWRFMTILFSAPR